MQGVIDKAIANNTYDAVMAAKEWELGDSVTIIVEKGAKVGQQAIVPLQDNAVVEGTVYAYGTNAEAGQGTILLVGTEDKAYTGSVGNFSGFENVVVTKGSSMTTTSATANIFDATIHTHTVTQENMTQAITTTAGTVAVNAPITLNLNSDGTLPSGKYMLIDASAGTVDQTNWDAAHVSVIGLTQTLSDLRWDGNILYLLYQGKDAQSAMAANWGVFKSSQTFVSTLWGSRSF